MSEEDYKKSLEMIERLKVTGVYDKYLVGDYQYEFNEEIDGCPVRGFPVSYTHLTLPTILLV